MTNILSAGDELEILSIPDIMGLINSFQITEFPDYAGSTIYWLCIEKLQIIKRHKSNKQVNE